MAIIRTESDKSLLFILPTWCGMGMKRTTMVIMPLIALWEDIMWRYRKLELECVEWLSSQMANGVDIVLVTLEGYFSTAFIKFI